MTPPLDVVVIGTIIAALVLFLLTAAVLAAYLVAVVRRTAHGLLPWHVIGIAGSYDLWIAATLTYLLDVPGGVPLAAVAAGSGIVALLLILLHELGKVRRGKSTSAPLDPTARQGGTDVVEGTDPGTWRARGHRGL